MDKALLDTDIFSEILKARDKVVASQATIYHARFGQYTIAAITVMEVVKGLHKLQEPGRIKTFVSSLVGVEIVAVDTATAILAGEIYADLEHSGQPIGRADPIIAATAIRYGLLLTTGNTKHYARVQALGYPFKLDNWRL